MDDPAYRLLQAWMLAYEADPDAAQMIIWLAVLVAAGDT
jgi:hypothetical protein